MAQIVAQKALLLGGLRLGDPADCKVLLAMPKATAAETFDRIDRLQEMILNGEPPTFVSPLRDKRGGSPERRATDC